MLLLQRGHKLRSNLVTDEQISRAELPDNLHQLEQSDQIQGIHALIRYVSYSHSLTTVIDYMDITNGQIYSVLHSIYGYMYDVIHIIIILMWY